MYHRLSHTVECSVSASPHSLLSCTMHCLVALFVVRFVLLWDVNARAFKHSSLKDFMLMATISRLAMCWYVVMQNLALFHLQARESISRDCSEPQPFPCLLCYSGVEAA